MKDFWEGRDPCWILMGCSEYVTRNCPAFHFRERPCWEIPYTQCDLLTNIKGECNRCKVFRLYEKLNNNSSE